VLAEEAKRRALQSFVRDGLVALTDQEVAEDFGKTVEVMRRRANKARRELFGPISDAAIIKRAQRQHARKKKSFRHCQEPACGKQLGPLTHAGRRYCEEHRLPAARIRRHRRQTAAPPKQQPPQAAITQPISAYLRGRARNGHTGQNAREANAGAHSQKRRY
jgi:hypothetical protein